MTKSREAVDRTRLHRVWKAILVGYATVAVAACVFMPVLLIAAVMLALAVLCGRLIYRGRDRYIPNLYSRDITTYDDGYGAFIARTLAEMRGCKIPGHTVLWEAARLPESTPSDELLLDLGVWIGWSTRLIADASQRTVYGFDTFEGLVEDWQVDDQALVKRGTFSLEDPRAQRFLRNTGVTLDGGVPSALGRKVQFIKGSTYDTLAPFLADHPAPIRLFHMDLDTYESCLHALEACRTQFVVGSILVFDEYLVTNAEMQAFYEFQAKYGIEWRCRAWGLEIMEMNVEMITSRRKRLYYYVDWISKYWLLSDGRYAWQFLGKRFWRFWLGAPLDDIRFMLSAGGQRKSVSIEITNLGTLNTTNQGV